MLERDIHAAVAQFLRYALPAESVWFHPVNEGKRALQAQRDFVDLGGLAGLPDLVIAHGGKVWAIELKAPKKYPTARQRAVHDRLRRAGIPVAICHSSHDVELALIAWGIPLRLSGKIGRAAPARNAEPPFALQMAD